MFLFFFNVERFNQQLTLNKSANNNKKVSGYRILFFFKEKCQPKQYHQQQHNAKSISRIFFPHDNARMEYWTTEHQHNTTAKRFFPFFIYLTTTKKNNRKKIKESEQHDYNENVFSVREKYTNEFFLYSVLYEWFFVFLWCGSKSRSAIFYSSQFLHIFVFAFYFYSNVDRICYMVEITRNFLAVRCMMCLHLFCSAILKCMKALLCFLYFF